MIVFDFMHWLGMSVAVLRSRWDWPPPLMNVRCRYSKTAWVCEVIWEVIELPILQFSPFASASHQIEIDHIVYTLYIYLYICNRSAEHAHTPQHAVFENSKLERVLQSIKFDTFVRTCTHYLMICVDVIGFITLTHPHACTLKHLDAAKYCFQYRWSLTQSFAPPIRLTDKCGWDRRVGCDRCPEFTTVVLNLDKEEDEKESWRLPFETKGAYALWAELSDDHCCAWSVLWMITAAYDYCCVLWPVSTRTCMLRLQSFIVKPSWSQQATLKERLLLFVLSCCGGMNAVMESLSSNGVSARLFCPSVSSMAIW